MSVSAMYNPEIPPPTTTTSQDNGLKDDFSSSGKKIEKVKFEGICDWIQKCFKRSVFFSEEARKGSSEPPLKNCTVFTYLLKNSASII